MNLSDQPEQSSLTTVTYPPNLLISRTLCSFPSFQKAHRHGLKATGIFHMLYLEIPVPAILNNTTRSAAEVSTEKSEFNSKDSQS